MNQIMKETTPKIKQEIPLQSKYGYSFQIPDWLFEKSDEACYELLSQIGRIEHYPAILATHTEEVARFFGLDKMLWNSFRTQVGNNRRKFNFYNDLPVVCYPVFIRQMKEQADLLGIPCKESVDSRGFHYFSTDENPQHMVKLGNPCHSNRGIQLVTMRGIILLAYYMERNPRFATPVTCDIVRLCRETGFDQTPQLESNHISESAPAPEIPAEPTPEPAKMDYAETLRKLFDSVLTLVEKQAEERGAEKIVQKLKEAGKL